MSLLVPRGTVRGRARVVGQVTPPLLLPAGVVPPRPAEGPGEERVGSTTNIVIPVGVGATLTHSFDFVHAGLAPTLSLLLVGVYVRGRTKEAVRLQRELEKGPEKGQGVGGLERELSERESVNIRVTLGWPPGHTNSNSRPDAVQFQTIETGEATGDYLAWEEVGPGSWGFLRWAGSETTGDHEKLTVTTEHLEGLAEVESVNLHLAVTETWNATPRPPSKAAPGTIAIGTATRGVVDKQQALVR